jgi:hypothetical protein
MGASSQQASPDPIESLGTKAHMAQSQNGMKGEETLVASLWSGDVGPVLNGRLMLIVAEACVVLCSYDIFGCKVKDV